MDVQEVTNRFKHHPPSNDAVRAAHETIRDRFLHLALTMNAVVPDGREKALMLTKLEEAMFHANAGVARTQTAGGE